MINPAIPRAYESMKRSCSITPFQHQAQAVASLMEAFERWGGGALLHEIGAGKTYTSLASLLELHERGQASLALAVCPLSVIGAWQKDGEAAGIEVVALTGTRAKKEAMLQRALLGHDGRSPLLIVINYESMRIMEALLRAARFDVIFADEVQRIKAAGTKQSRALHRIGKAAKFRVGMSGTPVSEGALGYYGIFRFIDDRLFGTSYTNFTSRFAYSIPMGSFTKKVINPHTLPELERLVMERSHRVTKLEAVDLPEEMDTTISFDLQPKTRKLYDELRRESLAELADEFGALGEIVAETALTKMLRLQQLTGGFAQLDDGPLTMVDDSKLRVLKDLWEDLKDAGKKSVVFYRFTAEGDMIIDAAKKAGLDPAWINGKVKGEDRREMVRRFQDDSECLVFVAQIQAASEGITLTAADTSIYYSTGFSSGQFEQSRGRIHRIGQTKPVTHVHLAARDSIDEHVLRVLQEKRSVSEDLVSGGWKRWLGGA